MLMKCVKKEILCRRCERAYLKLYLSESQELVQSELAALDDLEKQKNQLKDIHMQQLLKLREELFAIEREKQKTHLQEVISLSYTHSSCMYSAVNS